jgi:hypothetical protein
MAVERCYLCDEESRLRRRYGPEALEEGIRCPICYEPTCRHHLTTVRWRWRESGALEAEKVCQGCVRAWRHRSWQTHLRDWIT